MPSPVDTIKSASALDAGLPPQRLDLDKEPIARESEKKSSAQPRDQSSLISLNPEIKPQPQPEKGLVSKITTSISNFFAATLGWAWGSTPAKEIPADMKIESGTGSVQSISSIPSLSKPEIKNQERANEAVRFANKQIRISGEENNTHIREEELDPKPYSERDLIKLLVETFKLQNKNYQVSIVNLNEMRGNAQKQLVRLNEEKKINDEAADGFHKILNVTGIIAKVGFVLTVGGLAITGAFVFSGGIAAIPMGVAIAQGGVALMTGFNQIAKAIVDDKLNKNRGESAMINYKHGEAKFQMESTYREIKAAIESASKAEKDMLEIAKKQYEFIQSNHITAN